MVEAEKINYIESTVESKYPSNWYVLNCICLSYYFIDCLRCTIGRISGLQSVNNGWNHEEWTNRFIGLIEKLHQLHLLIMRPTPLCQHEINNVQSLVLEFGVLWRNLGYSVTPKVHQLEIHVPLFLQHHHTIGMCSEQSLEHQHKTFNRFDTMY